jgi:transketolase
MSSLCENHTNEGEASICNLDPVFEERCVNSVRVLSADIVQKANSGHPGAPMGCAPMAHLLFGETMNFSPHNAKWDNRDRFVLSNGHACALLYSMLHLTGYAVSMDDLKQFRQLGSITPGHPENFVTPGVEVSTGPLGQGLSNAVGMAMTERHLAATFNQPGFNIVDHFTYVICGDGCLQEGVTSETSSLAGHLGLGKLIVLYDDNLITIDGHTELSFTEDVGKRYESYGWQVLTVADGNNLNTLRGAIAEAKADSKRPTLIKIRTIIGYGSTKQGTHGVHGAPLGAPDIKQVKEKFGFNGDVSFSVEPKVLDHYRAHGARGAELEKAWNKTFEAYAGEHPHLASEYTRRFKGELPAGWKDEMPTFSVSEPKALATRETSSKVLNYCASKLSELFGGSADLTPSNLTALTGAGDFQMDTPAGRYIRFGVREHGMAAICNGIFAHGGARPFCATFLNFIGYALGSVRLSALSRFGVLYVMTHDSIGLGEDGPTHQPVEMLEALRATPNLYTMRPCDGNETVGAYVVAMESPHTPVVLSLSRQACPTLEGSSATKTQLGAYVLQEHKGTSCSSENPTLILASTGGEVCVTCQTARALVAADASLWVRVVSMPCWELFEAQTVAYQLSIFPDGSPVMSIEASGAHGWQKFAHAPYGMQSFGISAPGGDALKHFGFTVDNLTARANEVITFYKGRQVTSLINFPRFTVGKALH